MCGQGSRSIRRIGHAYSQPRNYRRRLLLGCGVTCPTAQGSPAKIPDRTVVAISKTRAEPSSTRSVEAVLGASSKRRSVSVLGSSLPDQRHRDTHVAQPHEASHPTRNLTFDRSPKDLHPIENLNPERARSRRIAGEVRCVLVRGR